MQHPDIDGDLVRTAHFAATLAASEGEIEEAQRLRYRVFAGEFGARLPGSAPGLDRDDLDAFCHHLLVRERQSGALVGTYRILPAERARAAGGFYAEREFDLSRLRGLQPLTVEVGRACVHPDFRHGPVIALLWAALLRWVTASGSGNIIGCASVSLADGHAPAAAICGRLCEEYLGPERWRVFPHRPFPTRDWSRTLPVEVPSLIRGYLRLGALVCGEPAWDEEFNTADLLMLLPLSQLDPRYARRLLRLGAAPEAPHDRGHARAA
jgi:putative hemolysin